MTIAKQMQIDNLVDSIIALSRQIEKLQAAITEGQTKWAGESPRVVLVNSAKALLHDVAKLQDIQGAGEWSETHRQMALSILN